MACIPCQTYHLKLFEAICLEHSHRAHTCSRIIPVPIPYTELQLSRMPPANPGATTDKSLLVNLREQQWEQGYRILCTMGVIEDKNGLRKERAWPRWWRQDWLATTKQVSDRDLHTLINQVSPLFVLVIKPAGRRWMAMHKDADQCKQRKWSISQPSSSPAGT